MHLSEAKAEGLKFFIFGGYGTGKTYFASSLPKPIYIFDCDKGIKTVYNKYRDSLDDTEIDFDTYFEGPDLGPPKKMSFIKKSVIIPNAEKKEAIKISGEAYLDLETKLVSLIQDDDCKYKTVVLDSLSSFAKIFQDFIISLKIGQQRDRGVPNLNDMGIFIRKLEDFINLFLKLSSKGIITVITAHMQLKEDIRGIKTGDPIKDAENLDYLGTYRVPSVIGKDLPYKLGKWFDEVYFSYAERYGSESDYFFETKSNKDIFCKSRSDKMPAIVEQDWEVIKKYLI